MTIGVIDFNLPKPSWLNFGRTAEPDNELTIEATTPNAAGSFYFTIGIRLQRDSSISWESGKLNKRDCSISSLNTDFLFNSDSIRFINSNPIFQSKSFVNKSSQYQLIELLSRYSEGNPLKDSIDICWDSGRTVEKELKDKFSNGTLTIINESCRWDSLIASERIVNIRTDSGFKHQLDIGIPFHNGFCYFCDVKIIWDNGIPPKHGWRTTPFTPLFPGKKWGLLNFVCPTPGQLNFGNRCFGSNNLLVAVKRSYRVINSAALIRVSDGADIPVSSLTVRLDRDSWCWTLSATLLGRTAYETVPAAPGLVQATINGFVWQFIPDDNNYGRSFGSFGGNLTGRSRIAELAAPFAASRVYRENNLLTSSQLVLQELPVDYILDWQLPDWVIPGDVYQYENLTPIESISRITKSSGGRIYPDPILKIIHAVPKWTQRPWSWSFVTDSTLPSSYTLNEKLSNQSGTAFESVMVSGGVHGGVVAMCKIAGTGGTTYAPSVVDTLITHLDAAIGRGIQELADSWPMKQYSLELPLQAQPAGAGLILPGTTLDFTDGLNGFRGLVTSVSISAGINSVTQTLELVSP